jgi:hypothetical protein
MDGLARGGFDIYTGNEVGWLYTRWMREVAVVREGMEAARVPRVVVQVPQMQRNLRSDFASWPVHREGLCDTLREGIVQLL